MKAKTRRLDLPYSLQKDEEQTRISRKEVAAIMRPFLTGEKNILDCEVPPPKSKKEKR